MAERSAYSTMLSDSPVLSPAGSNNLSPPFPSEYEPQQPTLWQKVRQWAGSLKLPGLVQQEPAPPTSGYLTLIPLSDSRLQPRSTRFTALFLLAFALAIASSVFLLVPRSVNVGELSVIADRMSWNVTKSTYQLRLLVKLPAFNPNYMQASIEGNLHVLFYGTEAGRARLDPVSLPPRANPKLIDVKIDASDVPSDYILSILTQCSTFPEVLIFFLKGKLTARFLLQRQHLSTIDTYFMIDCKNGGTVPSAQLLEAPLGEVPQGPSLSVGRNGALPPAVGAVGTAELSQGAVAAGGASGETAGAAAGVVAAIRGEGGGRGAGDSSSTAAGGKGGLGVAG